MPRGSRIVDEQQIVQDVRQFVIAKDGQANSVMKAAVACGGVVRQFWPPTMPAPNPIVMTTAEATSYDVKTPAQGQPRAKCYYDANSASLILSDPAGDFSIPVLAPVPRGTGQFLLKFDVVSGSFVLNDPDGVWVDVYSEGNLGVKEYYLPNTNAFPGQVLGEATVSVAADSGGGMPDLGSVVIKTINFIAERTGNNLLLSSAPWTLEDIKVNEVARARVDIDKDGFLRGFEGGVQVLVEAYAANWNTGFTVNAALVAGSVSGSTLGVPLSTSVKRTWEVAAGVGDSNTGTIDLTVSDGANSVTKRIVMTATSMDETSPSNISDDWTAYLQIDDEETTYSGLAAEAGGRIIFKPDGTLHAHTFTLPTRIPVNLPGYPVNWNDEAPAVSDPENYEIRLTVIAGESPMSGTVGVWLNLSGERQWTRDTYANANLPFETIVDETDGTYLVEIREVGRPDTVKSKTVRIIALAISNGTGISIP